MEIYFPMGVYADIFIGGSKVFHGLATILVASMLMDGLLGKSNKVFHFFRMRQRMNLQGVEIDINRL